MTSAEIINDETNEGFIQDFEPMEQTENEILVADSTMITSDNKAIDDSNGANNSDLEKLFEHTNENTVDNLDGRVNEQSAEIFSNYHRQLANWAIKTKQTRSAVNDLLKILHTNDETLPKDYRTLCKTPMDSHTQICEMDTGNYIHFGLEHCLTHFLWTNDLETDTILFDVSIDGVPVSKSSSSCLWPILINVIGYAPVMVVGVYFGDEKPKNINNFFKYFVDEK